jgi:hypothetical protein
MRGQHRKRAEEKIANDSALATEQGHLAKVSAEIEIIEHRAPRAAPCHSVIPASGTRRSGRSTESADPIADRHNYQFAQFLKKCAT